MVKTELTVDYPLVNDNFETLETANEFIENTSNELNNYTVNVMVYDESMVATSMFFSLRKRHNIEFVVYLKNFKGSNFIHSFLLSGHVKEVICE
jgi:hypothetical protein